MGAYSKEYERIMGRSKKTKEIILLGIRKGVVLELDTVFGVKRITGMVGDDVVTGSGLSQRTFCIHGGEARDLANIVVESLGTVRVASELGFNPIKVLEG